MEQTERLRSLSLDGFESTPDPDTIKPTLLPWQTVLLSDNALPVAQSLVSLDPSKTKPMANTDALVPWENGCIPEMPRDCWGMLIPLHQSSTHPIVLLRKEETFFGRGPLWHEEERNPDDEEFIQYEFKCKQIGRYIPKTPDPTCQNSSSQSGNFATAIQQNSVSPNHSKSYHCFIKHWPPGGTVGTEHKNVPISVNTDRVSRVHHVYFKSGDLIIIHKDRSKCIAFIALLRDDEGYMQKQQKLATMIKIEPLVTIKEEPPELGNSTINHRIKSPPVLAQQVSNARRQKRSKTNQPSRSSTIKQEQDQNAHREFSLAIRESGSPAGLNSQQESQQLPVNLGTMVKVER